MIISNIKGRIRFKDSAFKDGEVIAKLQNELNKIEGINKYRITEKIGTLLIEYNSDVIGENEIIELANKHMKDKEENKCIVTNISEALKDKGLNSMKQKFAKCGKGKGNMSANAGTIGNVLQIVNPLNSSNPLITVGKAFGLGFVGQKGIRACGRCLRR